MNSKKGGHIFASLIDKARKFDEGTKELSQMWSIPQSFVCGRSDRKHEVDSYVEALYHDLQYMQKSLNNDRATLTKHNQSIESDLLGIEDEVNKMNKDFEEVESLFVDFGYNPELTYDDKFLLKSPETSTLESMEVEFTPGLKWSRKSRSVSTCNSSISTFQDSVIVDNHLFATPLANRKPLRPLDYENTPSSLIRQSPFISKTPASISRLSPPKEPTFSKHFYEQFKK